MFSAFKYNYDYSFSCRLSRICWWWGNHWSLTRDAWLVVQTGQDKNNKSWCAWILLDFPAPCTPLSCLMKIDTDIHQWQTYSQHLTNKNIMNTYGSVYLRVCDDGMETVLYRSWGRMGGPPCCWKSLLICRRCNPWHLVRDSTSFPIFKILS